MGVVISVASRSMSTFTFSERFGKGARASAGSGGAELGAAGCVRADCGSGGAGLGAAGSVRAGCESGGAELGAAGDVGADCARGA